MRRLLLITMAVSLSAVALPHAADDLILSRFSDYLDSLRVQAGIPGLAATLVRPDGTWERAYGLQDVDRNVQARADTPFHVDAATQVLTASIVLRCVDEGRLLLDEQIGQYAPNAPEPNATIRQLLSHTSGPPGNPVFSYRPERLDALAPAMAECTGRPFRGSIVEQLNRLSMIDSVPGADVLTLWPLGGDGVTPLAVERYGDLMQRLAKPYAVDSRGRPALSQYVANTLTPASGLISSVRDLASFDISLRRGVLIRADSLTLAWTAPVTANGARLPHGLGWFVQTYNGERIVWQFGVGDNASSSMIVTVPGRAMTLILLANSQGLARPFSLAAGDVTVSPFAKLFLSLFLR
jgi:CubicO group peptidase (beta-lactamase class C family)